jgi:hypothetical protein
VTEKVSHLPPDVIAAEIVGNLLAALEAFRAAAQGPV